MKDPSTDGEAAQWSMFSSFMLGGCGLNDWDINSEIVRAVAASPVGPYKMVQRVAGPFAHEPNMVQGRLKASSSADESENGAAAAGDYMLLGTMNAHTMAPPAGIVNCTRNIHPLAHETPGYQPPPQPDQSGMKLGLPVTESKDTYAWIASTPAGMASAKPV